MNLECCEYFSVDLEDSLYEKLLELIPFQPEEVVVFGKKHILKREAARYGTDKSQNYKGIGIERKPIQEWPDLLIELRDIMDKSVREYIPEHSSFNFVLCNWYPSGEAYIGYHSDSEDDYVEGACICSLSIGGTRDFLLKPVKKGKTEKVTLKHGDVFIMKCGFQQIYKHSIPKRAKIDKGRINLTFRCFV